MAASYEGKLTSWVTCHVCERLNKSFWSFDDFASSMGRCFMSLLIKSCSNNFSLILRSFWEQKSIPELENAFRIGSKSVGKAFERFVEPVIPNLKQVRFPGDPLEPDFGVILDTTNREAIKKRKNMNTKTNFEFDVLFY